MRQVAHVSTDLIGEPVLKSDVVTCTLSRYIDPQQIKPIIVRGFKDKPYNGKRMGQCSSQCMKKEELEEYEVLTFLTKGEILRIHEAFCNSCPRGKNYKQEKLTAEKVCTWPQLKVHPFRDRICKVFSTDGYFTFEDILGMASVFSDLACPIIKIEYAFHLYDFNEDGFIDEEDLQNFFRRLLNGKNLSEEEIVSLAHSVLEEADTDKDKMLSLLEFEYAITKSPDFLHSCRIDF